MRLDYSIALNFFTFLSYILTILKEDNIEYLNLLLFFYNSHIFTLSAAPLHRMPIVIRECFSVLKPGGLLLLRDYGNGLKKRRCH